MLFTFYLLNHNTFLLDYTPYNCPKLIESGQELTQQLNNLYFYISIELSINSLDALQLQDNHLIPFLFS